MRRLLVAVVLAFTTSTVSVNTNPPAAATDQVVVPFQLPGRVPWDDRNVEAQIAADGYTAALAAGWAEVDARYVAQAQADADAAARYDTIASSARARDISRTIVAIVVDAADRHGIDPVRFVRIMVCESGGDPTVRNRSSAEGLFQHLAQYWPGRAAAAGQPGGDWADPWVAAEVSAWYYAAAGSGPWAASRACWA